MPDFRSARRRIRLLLVVALALTAMLVAGLLAEGWQQSHWRDFF